MRMATIKNLHLTIQKLEIPLNGAESEQEIINAVEKCLREAFPDGVIFKTNTNSASITIPNSKKEECEKRLTRRRPYK